MFLLAETCPHGNAKGHGYLAKGAAIIVQFQAGQVVTQAFHPLDKCIQRVGRVMIRNSSPPKRQTISSLLKEFCISLAMVRRTMSPASCPNSSLICLKWSISAIIRPRAVWFLLAVAISAFRLSSICLRLYRPVSGSWIVCSSRFFAGSGSPEQRLCFPPVRQGGSGFPPRQGFAGTKAQRPHHSQTAARNGRC